jgi:hypothetical protein
MKLDGIIGLIAAVISIIIVGKSSEFKNKSQKIMCKLPEGNYGQFCSSHIEYIPANDTVEARCKFTADCDVLERNQPRVHNEAYYPPYVSFFGIENINGTITHPTNFSICNDNHLASEPQPTKHTFFILRMF